MSRKLDFVCLWFLWNVSRGSKQEALSSSVIGILLAPCIYETLGVTKTLNSFYTQRIRVTNKEMFYGAVL